MQNLAIVLLAVWLILAGLASLLNIRLPYLDLALPLLAVAAGVLLLVEGRRAKLGGRAAITLLAIYLVVSGALSLFAIHIPAEGLLTGALAIASGVLLLLKR